MGIEKLDVYPELKGQFLLNAKAKKILADTDWQVIRHRDQIDLGISTNLTNEEYQQLLQDRQTARDSII